MGLWEGYQANFLRNVFMNPFEVTAYIMLTEFLLKNDYMEDGFPLYLLCGALAGVNGLMIGNPFDVIRTVM